MIFYAPYESRYNAAFVLRDHLNAAARKTPASGIMPFLASSGMYETDIETSVCEGFQVILERYSRGRLVSEVLKSDIDVVDLPPQIYEVFQHDENAILHDRSIRRREIFCKTDVAKLIATREAWRDIDALAKVFKSGLEQIGEEYVCAFSKAEEKIQEELALAEKAARAVVEISAGRDYAIIPS